MGRGFIYERGEPFFMAGGETGCLLVHGFTGSPNEMRWLGEYLNQRGHTVLGVRVNGHGTRVEDMIRTRWQDWTASVEDGHYILEGCTKRVVVMGLSMGGVLSVYHASRFPVAGIVAMSTPYFFPEGLMSWAKPFLPLVSKLIPTRAKGPDEWFNPEAGVGHVCYDTDPVRSAVELDTLMEEMRKAAVGVFAPALVVHSRGDAAIGPENAEALFAALGSEDKELMWVENAGHVVTRDGDKELLFEAAAAFVGRVGG